MYCESRRGTCPANYSNLVGNGGAGTSVILFLAAAATKKDTQILLHRQHPAACGFEARTGVRVHTGRVFTHLGCDFRRVTRPANYSNVISGGGSVGALAPFFVLC